ncbi:MAG: crossover junction endodeoxyribonuclease RuvC [Candidatus Caenarcaniphilales bacterium]|nr:crossover junction endodeoxyribonuclease RuvC [Candidatus Caenarcaniphilales bacterium]
MRRVIGLDPGLARLGYAVMEYDLMPFRQRLLECGVITTSPDSDLSQRLLVIYKDLTEILRHFKPEEAAVELIYFAKNIKTAITVSHARGVILMSLAKYGISEIQEFTPTQLKQILFGNGRASKNQIQSIVSYTLDLPGTIKPDDAADAVALALATIRSQIHTQI